MLPDHMVLLGVAAVVVTTLAVVTETLARRQKFPQWAARKVLHLVAISACALVPYLLSDLLPLIVLVAAAEFLLLWLVGSGRLFRQEDGRRSWGIALFPLPYLLLLILFPAPDDRWLIAMPMLLLAVSDAAAAVIGTLVRSTAYRAMHDRKSMAGSLAFVISAWSILLLFPSPLQAAPTPELLALSLLVAVLLAAMEALGHQGRDNLYIPLGAVLLLHHLDGAAMPPLIAGWATVLAAVPFVFLTVRRRWLTLGGALAAALLGVLVVLFQGALWLVPLALFFLSSTLLGRSLKGRSGAVDAKHGGPRDAVQVFSNGGPYLLAALLLPTEQAHWAMLVSMAVATADTWASEIGVALRGRTYDILAMKPVPVGVSGGVSMPGTLGGLGGAALIGILGGLLLAGPRTVWLLPLPAAALVAWGILGMVADSLVGASLQARYRLRNGTLSDRSLPGSERIGGIAWMDNDRVNLLSNAAITTAALMV